MKRLVVRIAALGTVVVLGLIAIAQAQRGAKDSPSADDSPACSPNSAAEQPAAPNLVPADQAGNPLRGTGGPSDAGSSVPPADVLPDDQRPGLMSAASASGGPPSGVAATDPFNHRTGPALSAAGAPAARALGGNTAADPPATSLPPEQLASAPTSYPDLRDPSLSPPSHTGVSVGAGTPGGSTVGGPSAGTPPASSESYPQLRAPASNGGEPAPFRIDPQATPTSISPAGADSASDSFPRRAAIGQGYLDPPTAGDTAAAVAPGAYGQGTGRPGAKSLEGPQSPQLTVEKFAPEQIQVGKPAKFRVVVRNTGKVAASGVEVRDEVPKGTRLIATTPRASRGARGELVWTLGTIKPGEESSVEVQLMPTAEGEIGSVATVRFNADASARSVCTKPELMIATSGPKQVLIGEELTLSIEVSNPGSGIATGVVLEEHVPSGLQHPAGGHLEYEVGDLPPGESRKLELTLTASRPGPVTNLLTARGEASLKTEDRLELVVVAPQLDIAMNGPARRYLEREATYQLSISNPGTAPAEQVELVAYLPSGLKFISANNAGHYDEADRAVHWRLEELPSSETGTVELVTMPVEAGQQKLRFRGTAKKGLAVEKEKPVVVEGIAAIMFQAVDVTDPIEVGGETTYEIRVVNQGTKASTNVRLAVQLPPQMQAVAAEGPTRYAADAGRVLFDGLARLAPKADTTFRVRAQALRPGDLRTRIQLLTDEMQTPVTKEESTRVYSDQ